MPIDIPASARRSWRRAGHAASRAALLALALGAAACSLDVTNPNAATEEAVLSTPAGLKAVTIGLQGRVGNAIEEAVWIPGLVSGELGNTNASQSTQREFQDFPDATANAEIEETNPELLDLWAKWYEVVRSADDILNNADAVTLAPGTKSGMTALARTMKALAFGTLIESFEQIPLEPSQPNPAFSPRADVLARARELLAAARADLDAQAPSDEFTTTLLSPGLDLPSTIRALQARYALAAGDYEAALAFANEVPATASSLITYTSTDRNPLTGVFHELGYFAALQAFRTNAEAGDLRVDRYTTNETQSAFGGATLVGLAVYLDQTDPIELFRQDELTLIRAEAHARADRLPEARTALNAVRTANGLSEKDATDLPTQAAVLDEIYRQRTYSLYLTGLHWADERRFGRVDTEAKVAWLPYPLSERSTNTNVPENP
ncbi:MAG TPA: RagB/SusD family nutrient uptake outer membrane protein [Gemmatimonadaceae bacterium]|nr:RagB/SusD family nutrient uptake outer membrane protein [Gemmatimonadaceae bacterium]